jgi:hypothetical protein
MQKIAKIIYNHRMVSRSVVIAYSRIDPTLEFMHIVLCAHISSHHLCHFVYFPFFHFYLFLLSFQSNSFCYVAFFFSLCTRLYPCSFLFIKFCWYCICTLFTLSILCLVLSHITSLVVSIGLTCSYEVSADLKKSKQKE